MRAAFPYGPRDPVEPTNTMLIAATAPVSAARLPRRPRCPTSCATSAPAPRERLRRRCAAASVYTDDRAPVEWLVDASIVQVAAHGER